MAAASIAQGRPAASPASTSVTWHILNAESSHDLTQPGRQQQSHKQQPVLISSPLWQKLASAAPASSAGRPDEPTPSIAISIASAGRSRSRLGSAPALPALTCWAQQDADSTQGQEHHAKLPAEVANALGLGRLSARSRENHRLAIQRHAPIDLSVAYLAATSESGFDLANASQDAVVGQLDGRILHQGDLLRLRLDSAFLSLRVVMTEPVLQGRFDARSTQVLVTLDDDDDSLDADGAANGDLTISSTSDLATTTASSDMADADDDDSDALSIDESYLAQSILQDFTSDAAEAFLSSPLGLVSHQQQVAGRPSPRKSDVSAKKKKVCRVRELSDHGILQGAIAEYRKHAQVGDGRDGGEVDEIDDEDAVVLSERDLAAIGAFNGDWAIAELVGPDQARLVRLFSGANLPHASGGSSARTPSAWMSPMLRQNLSDSAFSPSPAGQTTMTLRPLGARAPSSGGEPRPPVAKTSPIPVPFADSLTIARVASPFSVDRAYQGLFLEALRTYFEGRQRICKQGDVIAVAIEAGKARFVRKEGDQAAASDAAMEDIHELRLPGTAAPQKTAVVHFKITTLTSELIVPAKPSTANGHGGKHEDEASIALRSQAGKLGCVVDPNVTKMVQTGVEKCRVADSARWLGVVSDTPDRPEDSAEASDDISPASVRSAPSPLTAVGSAYATVLELLNATLQPGAGRFGLHLSVLLKGARGCGKRTVARWVAQATGVQLIEIDCFDLVSDTDARTEGTLRARFDKAADCAPAILLLRNIDALARKSQALETGQEPAMATVLQKCVEELRAATSGLPAKNDAGGDGAAVASPSPAMPVAVFGTTSDPDKCPTGVLGCFKHEIAFQAPNEAERLQMLQIALDRVALSPDVDLKNLATQTAALVAADLVNLVSRAKLASVSRIRKEIGDRHDVRDVDLVLSGVVLTGSDFEQALNKARSSYSESIGAPKIPNVTWDDVGGLASVKSDILDTIQLPLEHPELFSDGLKKRSGILLYGPPGTGKTLLAKAVATSCSLNFFSVKGPELLNMYIGESEANVRRVFQRARDAKPCVIFFDELDSVAPKRGNQGDSGGVMDRIVSQLLAELDGMAGSSEGTDVFVIGATNRPDLLDPALLRPGRFDRMLYLSVSETHAAQLNILQALTRKFKLDSDLDDLGVIAEQCPFNLTGADFYALCSDAMLKAMTRKASEIDETIAKINATPGAKTHPHPLTPQYYLAEMATQDEIEVKVGRRDFEGALRELVPSVSEQEMAHYRQVQAKFSAPKKEDEMDGSDLAKRVGGDVQGPTLVLPQEKERERRLSTPSPSSPQQQHQGGKPSSPSRLPVRKPSAATPANGSGASGASGANGVNGSGQSDEATSGRNSRLGTREGDASPSPGGKGKGKAKASDEDAAAEARTRAKGKGRAQ
ncbi:uncharacterized protein PFL1_01592 [Pseudozyma flocculosa PF-1]|uniref:Peroxisomal ATPase PEX6 n=1 Tax=Pseudozyma flocculosa TaxID=84751 RepID=A0A5C3EXL4_9BASI|nr:uncharacterized protein PFL1_01592 [Pseudozyma flocculosa PF-1]EPQ30691.1 hypothetical protein PFL1_01592 [Pseudozyma flocculosa PF-1]SPO36974.1 related to PEX6 - peroxisomal assembly protein [Pseudozyma flocculosa]